MDLFRASDFSLQQLTDAYNQTRVDYIVPMPMNVARLKEYIDIYDVDLEASWVAMDGKIIYGLGMLGIRDCRAWITRVGVLPIGRRQGTGRAIVNRLLKSAERRKCGQVWIEVIAGNIPAQQLFLTGGFEITRELLVARRAPTGAPPSPGRGAQRCSDMDLAELDNARLLHRLRQREERPNWLNETESFRQIEELKGLSVSLAGGGRGWVAYQSGAYQLSHIVVEVQEGDSAEVTSSVLHALHKRHSTQDAVMENLPADSPCWPGFLSEGYFEVFRRLEMVKHSSVS